LAAVSYLHRGGGKRMTVKLHRCPMTWLKIEGHPCWRVQKELDEAGIDYEVVKGSMRRGKRDRVRDLTGQDRLPVIEFEDGTAYREDSKQMAERIRSGNLRPADGVPGTGALR
jgi:glutathione S-transferase